MKVKKAVSGGGPVYATMLHVRTCHIRTRHNYMFEGSEAGSIKCDTSALKVP